MTIAIWCILIAAVLPYVAFSFVKGVDPIRRALASANSTAGRRGPTARSSTGFETFPLFTAAVIVAQIVGGPSRIADVLAAVYILLRVGHLMAYLAGRQPLRSAAFGLGQLVAVAIFVSPLIR